MFGPILIEMVRAADLERMREVSMATVRGQARRERRRLLGPRRIARAWAAFWAPCDFALDPRSSAADRNSTDLTPCRDC
jgi:hypothetical protein